LKNAVFGVKFAENYLRAASLKKLDQRMLQMKNIVKIYINKRIQTFDASKFTQENSIKTLLGLFLFLNI
jgi:hypothetical protein